MLLDGKYLSNIIYENISEEINSLKTKNIIPKIAIILIGSNKESMVYVNMKLKKCTSLGILHNLINLEEDVSIDNVLKNINELNNDENIHGIMVQLPLPEHLKSSKQIICDTIDPKKDVDGLTSYSFGRLSTYGKIDLKNLNKIDFFISSTVYGVLKFIDFYNINIKGKKVGIIGNSTLLGIPLSIILSTNESTVEIFNKESGSLENQLLDKDIIISCTGVKHLVKEHMVKYGVTIIDIGIFVEFYDGKKTIYGDCDFENLKNKSSFITPVPGGVGPMTICSLVEQTIKSAKSISI